MAIVGGYTVFLPGFWEVQTFLFSYFMVFLFPVLFVGWKVVKRTRWYAPEEVDLKGEREEIEEVCFFLSFFFFFSVICSSPTNIILILPLRDPSGYSILAPSSHNHTRIPQINGSTRCLVGERIFSPLPLLFFYEVRRTASASAAASAADENTKKYLQLDTSMTITENEMK